MNIYVIAALGFVSFFAMLVIIFRQGGNWFAKKQKVQANHAADSLEGLFIFTDSSNIMLINIVVMILMPILAWFISGNFIIVVGSAILAFMLPKKVVRHLMKKRLEKFELQLPDALLMITGALRAGASLPIALESVVSDAAPPVSQEFDLLLREMRMGVDFSVALRNLETRVPLPDLLMVTSGMSLARDIGANLAETLESIGKTLRSKLQMEGKIRSLTAQGKMQGMVMAALPFFLMLVLNVMEPEAMAPLFNRWFGWITLAIVIVMDMIGYFFIKKITSIDV